MNKRERYNNVVVKLQEVCDKDTLSKVLSIIDPILAPRKKHFREDNLVCDSAGNITHIICRLSNLTLPATAEYFPRVSYGGVMVGEEYLGLTSMEADRISRKHKEDMKVAKDNIIKGIMENTLEVKEAKAELNILNSTKPDYSTIV